MNIPGYVNKSCNEKETDETIKAALSRANLEKKLKENEIKYRLLFENIGKDLKEHLDDLELINLLNTATLSGKDLDDICILASRGIKKIFSSSESSIFLLEESRNVLVMKSSSITVQVTKKIEGVLHSKIPELILSLQPSSVYKNVVTEGKPLLITDPKKIELLIRETAAISLLGGTLREKIYQEVMPVISRLLSLKSIMLFPLISSGEVIGIFSISSRGMLSEHDLKRLRNVSNQLSLILKKRKLRVDLENAKIAAEDSNKLKSVFLANMSHEIRTPLNSIIGFTDLVLSDSGLSEKNREFLSNSKKSSMLLLSLINEVLDLSKIEAGKITICESDCTLKDLMDTIEKRITILIVNKKRSIEIRKSYQSNIAEQIKCDSFRLEQVLNNLIGNAVKFTESGYLEYGYSLKNGMLEFYVRDTGLGIPEGKQESIFEPFIQASPDTAVKFGGTGLGLAITKKLVELMGGSLNLASKVGWGSTFYFTIPYKPGKKKKTIILNQLDRMADSENRKIKVLVVEDDRANRRLVEAILQKNSIPLVLSDNGRDAVSRYKTDRSIGLIFMDIHLPFLDGLEATKIIREIQKTENRKEIPIIALTASVMKEDRENIIQSGCNDCLTKPLDIEILLETLAKYSEK